MSDWHGLYSEGWTNEIVPDAFSHPAKFARGLIRRIYEHAVEEGWLVEGDTAVDPFAGVALGAADALALGLNWIGNELEPHFVDMGRGCECTGISKEDWVKCFGRWDRFRYKDGRHWCPHCVADAGQVLEDWEPALPGMEAQTATYKRNSGKVPFTSPHRYTGNLGLFAQYSRNGARAVLFQGDSRNLVDVLDGARVKGLVSSPPYANAGVHHAEETIDKTELQASLKRKTSGGRIGISAVSNYGHNRHNLGNMREGDHVKACISSPPYAGGCAHTGGDDPKPEHIEGGEFRFVEYGQSAGQLATLPEGDVRAVVSSPPWEANLSRDGRGTNLKIHKQLQEKYHRRYTERSFPLDIYGESEGQLGQEQGDTFWSAARVIVSQCYQVLAPGGVAIWVTKAFVRNKAIVDFPEQWRELCESCGFETLHKHKAWLVEDRGGQYALNGDLVEKRVERKSFFRRLYEKKYPENSIDYEVVWCMRKPADAPLFADVAVREV